MPKKILKTHIKNATSRIFDAVFDDADDLFFEIGQEYAKRYKYDADEFLDEVNELITQILKPLK